MSKTNDYKRSSHNSVVKEFEHAVWANLVLCTYVKQIDLTEDQPSVKEVAKVLHSVAYNYEIIKNAAKDFQKDNEWTNNKTVQELKFSNK